MNQYPNLLLTLLLAFTLLTPFHLARKYGLEPYPAIILPAGAFKVDVGAREINFNRTSVWGKDEKNIWTRLDVETFLAPIPVQYLDAITHNSFGLNSAEEKVIRLKKGVNILLSKQVTPREVQSAKDWLRQKLIQSGYTSDELMITVEKVSFDIETDQIITNKRTHEEILRLD